MRRRVGFIYLHDYLFLAGLFPFFASLTKASEADYMMLCAGSFLLILPIVNSYAWLRLMKTLGGYVAAGAVTSIFTLWFGRMLSATGKRSWLILALLAIACFAFFLAGVSAKNAYGEARRSYEATHPGDGIARFDLTPWEMETPFNDPRWTHWVFMGFFYIIGIFLHYETYLRIQFWLLVADIIVVSVYRYFQSMEEFWHDNRQVRHMPFKAMRKTHAVMGLFAGAFLILGMVPSILFGRELFPTFHEPEPIAYVQPEANFAPSGQGMDPEMEAWMGEFEEAKEPPAWVNALFMLVGYLIVVLFVVGMMIAIVQRIRETSRNFAMEGEDQVELLEDEEADAIRKRLAAARSQRTREALSIRRLYKKRIKKATKGIPVAWGSPQELEEKAGLFGEDIEELHDRYEEARYGGVRK